MISQKNKQGWRNPWVFGLLIVVFSGVLINARMLWNVMHHPTRLLDENYSVKNHDKGDAQWVQQQAERSTLGWQAKLHSPQRLQNDALASSEMARFLLLGSPALFQLELNDRDGTPIHGGKVTINAQWPGDPTFDFSGELHEVAPGHYEGDLAFSRPGNWDLLIRAESDGRPFDMEQKIFVAIPKQS